MDKPTRPMGAGLLLVHDGLAVFGVKRVEHRGSALFALTTGIGGKVEPGETFLECALRECLEEVGTEATVIPSTQTWAMQDEQVMETSPEPDGTLFVVMKPLPGFEHELVIRVYAALAQGRPEPVEDLHHLIFLPMGLVREVALGHVTAGSVPSLGGQVASDGTSRLPGEALICLIDSPEIYSPHLKSEISFHVKTLFGHHLHG